MVLFASFASSVGSSSPAHLWCSNKAKQRIIRVFNRLSCVGQAVFYMALYPSGWRDRTWNPWGRATCACVRIAPAPPYRFIQWRFWNMLNRIVIMGRLTKEPDLRTTSSFCVFWKRVGLLQQDARPHPSHRQRPQGLILAKFDNFWQISELLKPRTKSANWWFSTKDFIWYENCKKKQKVFHTSFWTLIGAERGIFYDYGRTEKRIYSWL